MLKWLDENFENTICCSLLAIMASVILVQVITRTVNYSLSWTEELARFCLIWLVYIGVSFAAAKKKHIQIDAVSKRLNTREQYFLALFSDSIFYVFSCVILFLSTQMVMNLYVLGQTSPALGLPMWLVYLAAPVGFALTSVRLLQHMFVTFGKLKQPSKQKVGG